MEIMNVNGFDKVFSGFSETSTPFFIFSVDLAIGLCYISHVANDGVWLSLVERFVRDEEVACSNHVTPTIDTADHNG